MGLPFSDSDRMPELTYHMHTFQPNTENPRSPDSLIYPCKLGKLDLYDDTGETEMHITDTPVREVGVWTNSTRYTRGCTYEVG
jgi:hypothetical protein